MLKKHPIAPLFSQGSSLYHMAMDILKAEDKDIDRIMAIYDEGRAFMRKSGNLRQWTGGYPSESLIADDIASGYLYKAVEDGTVLGAFFFAIIDDPTYHVIEGGKWLNEAPYAVLHRLASDGSYSGIADLCLDWCFTKTANLRVDTHQDNKVLQHILLKHGFTYCGIIYVRNHSPRLAYHKIL